MSVMACRLVINNIKDLDPNRKCFRLIGGVLVERTVKDVLPAITKNVEKVISKACLLGRAHPLFTGAGYRRYKRSSFSYQIPSVRRRRLRQVFSKSTICSSTREPDRYGVMSCKWFLLFVTFPYMLALLHVFNAECVGCNAAPMCETRRWDPRVIKSKAAPIMPPSLPQPERQACWFDRPSELRMAMCLQIINTFTRPAGDHLLFY